MRMSSPSISGVLAHVYTLQHYAEGLHFSAFHTNCNALRKLTTVGTYHKGAGVMVSGSCVDISKKVKG